MKIAIITHPLRHNYGGILQNYALQQVLKGMGHDVTTLEIIKIEGLPFKRKVILFIRYLFYLCLDKNGRFLHIWKGISTEQILSEETWKFVRTHIKEKRIIGYPKEKDYSVYIVGSDQVWRPRYFNIDVAFLNFTTGFSNIKRVAYAASFGTDSWEFNEQQTQKCSRLLSHFDKTSVREKSGIDLCKKYLKTDTIQVLDPTLLLYKEDYIKNLGLETVPQSKGNLFFYYLDSNPYKMDVLSQLEKELNGKAFTVNSKVEKIDAPLNERIQPPIEHWLRAFIDAEFIITDSFHGCVFSMIFNKPFIVIVNIDRGQSRFNSLLDMTAQQYRMFNEGCSISITPEILKCPDINIERQKNISLNFLREVCPPILY